MCVLHYPVDSDQKVRPRVVLVAHHLLELGDEPGLCAERDPALYLGDPPCQARPVVPERVPVHVKEVCLQALHEEAEHVESGLDVFLGDVEVLVSVTGQKMKNEK